MSTPIRINRKSMVAKFLYLISWIIDTLIVRTENATKARTQHISKKTDLSEYNLPEYFKAPEKFFSAGTKMPDVDVQFKAKKYGIDISYFSFRSETQSPHEENNTVTGRIFEAREMHGGAAAPCAIVVHGWREAGAFTPYYFLLGVLMARFGINTVFTTQPYHGSRTPKGSAWGDLMLSGDMEQTVLAFRQAVGDVRSLITWAGEKYEGKVGVMGLSLGGFITLQTSCVDSRISFALPIIASGDMIGGAWDRDVGRALVRDFKKAGLTKDRVRNNWRIITPIEFRSKLPRERIQFIASEFDMLIPASSVEELWLAWNEPPIKWLPCGHVSIFLFPRVLVRTIVSFIRNMG